MIGISVLTAHFTLAVQVSEAINSESTFKTILWGGIHPTIRPDECLEYADYVCVGEGDRAVPDLIEAIQIGKTDPEISGIWYRTENSTKQNGFGELTTNLDSIPNRDFSFNDHWIIDSEIGTIRELNQEVYAELCTPKYKDLMGEYRCYYRTSTSRGCPYHCTYCNNSVFFQNYTGHFRKRSVNNVIEELKAVTENNKFINLIQFIDDSFLSRNTKEIAEFSKLYKEKIGLPFRIIAYPTSITDEKLSMLVDAGLCHVSMGIESGSRTTMQKYERHIKPEAIIDAAKLLNKYVLLNKLEPPTYDIICNNPFESEAEKYETIQLMYQVPKPCTYSFYNLIPYPETVYYQQMKAAGLIHDETRQIYRTSYKFEPKDYPTILMFSLKWIPARILQRMNNRNILFHGLLYLFMKYKHKEGIFFNTLRYAKSIPSEILIMKIKNKIWRNKNGK